VAHRQLTGREGPKIRRVGGRGFTMPAGMLEDDAAGALRALRRGMGAGYQGTPGPHLSRLAVSD